MKTHQQLAITIALLASAAIAGDAGASCKYEKKLHHVFSAADFKTLEVNALAGLLEVRGNTGNEIVFEGRACSSDQKALEEISLDVEEGAPDLVLTVIIPFRDWGFDPDYAYMDVIVTLPASMPVSLRDSSGDIEVEGASVTSIDDSSGAIRVRDGKANLKIEDSSGDVEIWNHSGNLELTDSSGSIDVRNVDGDVYIPRDSSGDIEVKQVTGLVRVDRDSSGEIEIEDVGKTVVVDSDGSGGIEISNVKGDVTIGSDGSGNVRISKVTGSFTLNAKGSGDVRVRDVKGTVSTPR